MRPGLLAAAASKHRPSIVDLGLSNRIEQPHLPKWVKGKEVVAESLAVDSMNVAQYPEGKIPRIYYIFRKQIHSDCFR